jgi:predicted HTH domain antitoxin
MTESELKEVVEVPTKTLSIRINDEDYRFLSALAKEEKEDVSKKMRELVDLGRVMLAIEKYKKSEASIEKSARIAGVSISKMIDILKEHGVEANLEYEDYLKGLKSLQKVW